ncbi:MAG: sigma-70 family RNA polymerase sigma factor [Gemmatimonadota bacterium]|nr:MAG: sigma-70 family RNA polymerase sigma factor [Gemmatimonadota bacterium]
MTTVLNIPPCHPVYPGVSMQVPEASQAPTDAELIEAWRGGDEAAATDLVRRHTNAVARFLVAAGAGEDVDDLLQETFFRAFTRIDGFRGAASFRTWVMTIGSNALKDLRRKQARRPVVALEERDVVDHGSDPHAATLQRELEQRLERAVAELPLMQRDVFLLRAQQGIGYEEIAQVLETSVGAARVHYHQAVKRLKRALE